MLVGLTGGIGAGKSTAARYLSTLGAHVLDADAIAREVRREPACARELQDRFPECIGEDGGIREQAIAGIVFSQEHRRRELEGILHPRVIARLKECSTKILQSEPEAVILWDVALLFETGTQALVDTTLLITAPEPVRFERVILWDQCNDEQTLLRIRAQWPQEQKVPLADAVIENGSDVQAFCRALAQWFERIRVGH